MTLDHTRFAFEGCISNRQSLINELNLVSDCSLEDLATAAFKAWKLDFNQKVLGDYSLVLPIYKSLDKPLDASLNQAAVKECFICCSAFSSHRLFYKANSMTFSLSNHLDDFMQGALLDPNAIGQLFTQAYIVPPLTLVKEVRQLANGESQIWQLTPKFNDVSASCLVHKTLTLIEKLKVNDLLGKAIIEEGYVHSEQGETKRDESVQQMLDGDFSAFMALPVMSRLLNEPVTHMSQIRVFESLLIHESATYPSVTGMAELQHELTKEGRSSPLKGEHNVAQLNQQWDKASLLESKALKSLFTPIFKSRLRNAFRAQRQVQLRLRQEYQTQMLGFQGQTSTQFELPSFELWLDLMVRLPNQWQQERLMAKGVGKQIQFSCLNPGFISQSLTLKESKADKASPLSVVTGLSHSKPHETKPYFRLEDDSVINLYDAMQRLMMHGYKPVTKSLLKVVPPISAKLIKTHTQRQNVDAFCLKSLTLDHLSRHLSCTLASG